MECKEEFSMRSILWDIVLSRLEEYDENVEQFKSNVGLAFRAACFQNPNRAAEIYERTAQESEGMKLRFQEKYKCLMSLRLWRERMENNAKMLAKRHGLLTLEDYIKSEMTVLENDQYNAYKILKLADANSATLGKRTQKIVSDLYYLWNHMNETMRDHSEWLPVVCTEGNKTIEELREEDKKKKAKRK